MAVSVISTSEKQCVGEEADHLRHRLRAPVGGQGRVSLSSQLDGDEGGAELVRRVSKRVPVTESSA